jgi:hypothetical protein
VVLSAGTLEGLEGTTTSMSVTVPPETPSGDYEVKVTAADRADVPRVRTSVYTVHVDSAVPVAVPPASLRITSTRLSGSSIGIRHGWAAGTDAFGGITRYQARWVVDGVTGSPSTISPTTRSASRTLTGGHVYELEVRAGDAAGNWSPWLRGGPLSLQLVQDRSSTITSSGTWSRSTRSAWSGGTALHSRQKGASVSRSFTGRGIAFVTATASTRGRAQIWIDGVQVATVSLYAKTLTPRRVMFTRTWATPGPHTIKVVVAGTAGHPRVDLDAFVVIR